MIDRDKTTLRKIWEIIKIAQNKRRPKIPPGQYVTVKFPVFTYGTTPRIATDDWQLRVFGLVNKELLLKWADFTSLPYTDSTSDLHCVTQWSKMNNRWQGVPFTELMKRIYVNPEAHYVMIYCYDGYSTNLSLDVMIQSGVLATHYNGNPLEPDHGGPMRLVIPNRYGWKSAKWVNKIELMEKDRLGFWEKIGYHNNGDPWKEERFRK